MHAALFAAVWWGRHLIDWLDHAIDRALFGRVTGTAEDVCYIMLQPGSAHVIAPVGAVVGIVLLVGRRWARLLGWVILLVGCYLLDASLKPLFHRARPLNMQDWPGYSFPSGHMIGVSAVYGMLAWLVIGWRGMRWKRSAVGLAAALIISTAVGLILPGYHFLSDVLAGTAVGFGWLAICVSIVRRLEGAVPRRAPATTPV